VNCDIFNVSFSPPSLFFYDDSLQNAVFFKIMAIYYKGRTLIGKYVVPTIDWNKKKAINSQMLIHKIAKIFYNLNLCS